MQDLIKLGARLYISSINQPASQAHEVVELASTEHVELLTHGLA